MERKEIIKKHLIAAIDEKGFPIGYVEDEADWYAGIFIDENKKITAMGYAKDFMSDKVEDLSNIKFEDLGIVELAKLLEHGCVQKDKDFKYITATLKDEQDAEEQEPMEA